MRVLVTWSSKRGGTEGIGRIIGEELRARAFEVIAASVDDVRAVDSFDAVIVGGALYGNRWPRKMRSFVNRHERQLRKVPVWFFSSGPLDDSADREAIPYQSPNWTQALCADGRYADISRCYETDDGRTLVLPLVRRRGLPGRLATAGSLPMEPGNPEILPHARLRSAGR